MNELTKSRRQLLEILDGGTSLSSDDIFRLEGSLLADVENFETRALLLAAYRGNRKEKMADYVRHLTWFVDRSPDSELLRLLPLEINSFDVSLYGSVKVHWLTVLEGTPVNTAALGNCADFFLANDEIALAEKALAKGRLIEPNNSIWVRRLCDLNERAALKGDGERWSAALDLCQVAIEMSENQSLKLLELIRLCNLANAINDSDKAIKVAHSLLFMSEEIPTEQLDLAYAMHVANTIMGIVALKNGQINQAREYLQQSIPLSRSIAIYELGPDLSLASDLLSTGEKMAVTNFLDAFEQIDVCNQARDKLNSWRQRIIGRLESS
jgi:hypothetical protein